MNFSEILLVLASRENSNCPIATVLAKERNHGNNNTNHIITYNSGPAGDPGPQRTLGSQGPSGPAGAEGTPRLTGLNGKDESKGPIGDQGNEGESRKAEMLAVWEKMVFLETLM